MTTTATLRHLVASMSSTMPEPAGFSLVIEEGSATYGRAWRVCLRKDSSGGVAFILSGKTRSELESAIRAFLAGVDTCRNGYPTF